jgi:hypothetical protein
MAMYVAVRKWAELDRSKNRPLIRQWPRPCHLQISRLKRQNVSAVVGKLTVEVRYLSSKNRESQLSCCFKRTSDIVGMETRIVSLRTIWL